MNGEEDENGSSVASEAPEDPTVADDEQPEEEDGTFIKTTATLTRLSSVADLTSVDENA